MGIRTLAATMKQVLVLLCCAGFCIFVLGAANASAQAARVIGKKAKNKPLPSLAQAADQARGKVPSFKGPHRQVPNFTGRSRTQERGFQGPDELLQNVNGPNQATILPGSFDGADNDDNAAVVGFRVAPPDTNSDVGPNHIVQMVNLVTTVFDKSGAELDGGPFPSNAFWSDIGGLCEQYNQGDPVVLYDETKDRWVVSQFAFDESFLTYSQCVAVSLTPDPLGGWNRYEWSFNGIGFPDYPKFGIVHDSITMTANLFAPPFFFFSGTFIGVLDKSAMHAGTEAWMLYVNLSTNEFGFLPADLDGSGGAPALFATAMSRRRRFDIWELVPDWATTPPTGTYGRIAAVAIKRFDSDLCSASREACIPQPSPGDKLEAISDRLMHRLQVRDFGSYRTMVAAHTVDVGGGRAGIRWYELRESGGAWTLYQQGTFGPDDGKHRWMPSIAMNAAGDIGLGYLLSSDTTYLSTAVTGQSAANSGSGTMDAEEGLCQAGSGAQTGVARSGDYSATNVDPTNDTFWHTNEYGRVTGMYEWATRVCEFEIGAGSVDPPPPPPDGDPTDMHVESIATGTQGVGQGNKVGRATVMVLDDLGNAVSGVTVTGDFSGDINETVSGVTGADGAVTLLTTGTARGKVTLSFCVSSVTGGTLPYDPSDNADLAFACP